MAQLKANMVASGYPTEALSPCYETKRTTRAEFIGDLDKINAVILIGNTKFLEPFWKYAVGTVNSYLETAPQNYEYRRH